MGRTSFWSVWMEAAGTEGPKKIILGGDAGWLYPTKSGGRVRSAPL